MREQTWRAMFMGHEIVVRNVFGLNEGGFVCEAQLVIDGAIVVAAELCEVVADAVGIGQPQRSHVAGCR